VAAPFAGLFGWLLINRYSILISMLNDFRSLTMTEKLQRIPYVIEYKFWEVVIDLLDSDDDTIELLVNFAYQMSQKLTVKSFLFQAVFLIFMGTIIGLAIGILII
jgi:hypothetical protein